MAHFNISKTARQLQRSVMRDLMKYAVDPDIVSMAGGLPASECLPVEVLQDCADRVLSRDRSEALQYGPPFEPLKEWIANYMQKQGVDCTAEQIHITNGAQQGLAILSRLFCDPGEPAVIEAVTFTGVQQVTVGRRLLVETVPTDLQTGVDVEALERAFKRDPRPQMAILIPNFHNPLGVSISVEKRRAILALAEKYAVPIVEDDPYSPLRFSGRAVPSMKALDRSGMVFYIGSFSKMLAPAARLGWIVAPGELGDRITVLRESLDLESSQLWQRIVFEFLDHGHLEPHLDRLNSVNRRRKEICIRELQKHLAPLGVHWTDPQGGLFIWLTLPEGIDSMRMFRRVIAKKMAYIPGGAFAVKGGYQNTIRLNFSNLADDQIPVAIQRLAEGIAEERQEKGQ